MNIKEQSIWAAKTLFERGLVTGSTGNISYRENDVVYVSKSGSCFGLIDDNSFAKVTLNGEILEGKPSKEWPMHLKLYKENSEINSVIHTHSFYSTLFSCLDDVCIKELYKYTPYLDMQTGGKIAVVDYGKPGSEDLFNKFFAKADKDINCYILKNHGVFVSADNPLKAFYIIEEFEQSSKIALSIKKDLNFKAIN